jgi:lipopolysaccharide/colanic/teichoic acid biosynthesis glycosyltransferase
MRSAPSSAEPAAGGFAGAAPPVPPVARARRSQVLKRGFDLLAAGAGLLLLWPLFLAVALAIRFGDGGPVFFRQERVGRGGKPFRMWKFRSMRVNAERAGPLLTVGGDPRVTPVGRVLRRTKLDELPQLLNVLKSEMSLVGPRPEVARYVACYTDAQRAVLELVPGITDPASLAYLDEEALLAKAADPELAYRTQVMPAKIDLNLAYAARASLAGDIGVIAATVVRLVRGRGSREIGGVAGAGGNSARRVRG